jgi:hypothetical protein
MINTFFTSQAWLKAYLPISQNVQFQDLVPHLQTTHQINLNEFLGTNFFNYLLNTYSAQTLNANETILVEDFIKPYTAWQTLFYAFPYMSYQLFNKGVLQLTSENGNATDLDVIKYMQKLTNDRAQWFSQRLINYLCDNSSLFPQYQTNNGDDIKPFKGNTTYEADLYLGFDYHDRQNRLSRYLRE